MQVTLLRLMQVTLLRKTVPKAEERS